MSFNDAKFGDSATARECRILMELKQMMIHTWSNVKPVSLDSETDIAPDEPHFSDHELNDFRLSFRYAICDTPLRLFLRTNLFTLLYSLKGSNRAMFAQVRPLSLYGAASNRLNEFFITSSTSKMDATFPDLSQ
jgi:hypothetical protein